jgi:polysaccharide biosynthesis/export protein
MKWMRNLVRGLMSVWLLMAALAHAAPAGDYVLGTGDVIRISVYQNPDLTVETRISEGGSVSYPLLGTVKLGGLSVGDAEKKITNGLRDGNYIKQPQVSILVMQVKGNQVSVLGMVNRPGRYPLEVSNTKLSEIIAQAGGLVPGSSADVVAITGERNGKSFRKEIDFPMIFAADSKVEDMLLQNGDVIYVDRVSFVYVYGEVQSPGTKTLQRDMTMLQLLASCGGLSLRGTEKGIRVHRRDPETGKINILQIGLNDPVLKDDVIYVKESLF